MRVISIFLGLFSLVISQETKCVLPTREEGKCVDWMGCPAYMNYIETQRSDPKSAQFLKDRICRVELPDVYLCCPLTQCQTPRRNLAKVTIPTEEECGIRKILATDEPGSWPWIAAIGTNDPTRGFIALCSGALITRRHVLSAAHCFSIHWENVVVRLGEYHLDHDDFGEQPQEYAVMLFSIEHYTPINQNDIVILPLDRDVVFTDYIRPVCLPFPFVDQDFAGQRLTLAGWGATGFGDNGSRVLNTGSVPVFSLTACLQMLKGSQRFGHEILCAGDESGDSCTGDSGAPLIYYSRERDRFYIVGIVISGPVKCATTGHPGQYTRVTSYLGFIKKSLNIF